jgi:hypothetical protein
VQFKTLAALGAQEQRTRLGDGRFKVFLGAGLDVDLCDFSDHWVRPFCESSRL